MNINSEYVSVRQPTSSTAIAKNTAKAVTNFADILQGQKNIAAGTAPTVTKADRNNWRNADFSHMTPKQMRAISKDMHQHGDIDLDAMISLQAIGPLGKAGANGEFIPFTSEEREQIDNTPINYRQTVADQRDNIERMGRTLDPTSAYSMWVKLDQLLGQTTASVAAKV